MASKYKPRPDSITAQVWAVLKELHVVTPKQVGERTGITAMQATGALRELYKRGKLLRSKTFGTHGMYSYSLKNAPALLKSSNVAASPERPADNVDLSILRAEIEALRQWKADAIAKHPDLAPVDPLLLKAREVLAVVLRASKDENNADLANEGYWDNSLTIKSLLEVLREG